MARDLLIDTDVYVMRMIREAERRTLEHIHRHGQMVVDFKRRMLFVHPHHMKAGHALWRGRP